MPSLLNEILVCYDVKCNKRRTRLFEGLKDLGLLHIQESVFWGWVNPAEEKSLATLFRALLDPVTDRAFAARVGLAGTTRAALFGYSAQSFSPFLPFDVV